MQNDRTGQVAVVFVSFRNDADMVGYAEAAAAMDALAAAQPGYRGVDSAREAGGMGVTVSYWADDAAAIAWRNQPEHAAIRERGRALWYESYSVSVARIERSYDWVRP
ncbi:antibiotic biosynthesis monooxygenase [Sphingomonas sp. OK281]|uniref:antibiotic biosynthesis monooxygenase n=1 Tax=Sphingomonas sp. OK281 TaxID=1881067 RepID=UPI0008E8A045|nr:antibiotic biosynthesis monooxygenase [Sphingomonas sp. OK281]SFN98275.1 Heme-degrading monooxygenase HmoA [Sphingomonas sp. OK281]